MTDELLASIEKCLGPQIEKLGFSLLKFGENAWISDQI
jgi:hypothetical protein